MGLSETMRGTRQGWAEQETPSLPSLPPVCQSHHLSPPPVALSTSFLPSFEEGKEE